MKYLRKFNESIESTIKMHKNTVPFIVITYNNKQRDALKMLGFDEVSDEDIKDLELDEYEYNNVTGNWHLGGHYLKKIDN